MNPVSALLAFVGGQWVINQVYNEVEKAVVTREAYRYARSKGKPVLDFGCGSNPKGDYNVDIVPRAAPHFIKIQTFTKPHLPFPDKFFGAALCFHVLEHTNDPQHTLRELSRVSERNFILTPSPFWWRTWLHGGHKWIFIDGVYFRNPLHLTWEELNSNPLLYPE